MTDDLDWLQQSYEEQCDGSWEHEHGVKIDTLDNPGWTLEADPSNTALKNTNMDRVLVERSKRDWMAYEVRESKFMAAGGPRCLGELIGAFRQYVESQSAGQ